MFLKVRGQFSLFWMVYVLSTSGFLKLSCLSAPLPIPEKLQGQKGGARDSCWPTHSGLPLFPLAFGSRVPELRWELEWCPEGMRSGPPCVCSQAALQASVAHVSRPVEGTSESQEHFPPDLSVLNTPTSVGVLFSCREREVIVGLILNSRHSKFFKNVVVGFEWAVRKGT